MLKSCLNLKNLSICNQLVLIKNFKSNCFSKFNIIDRSKFNSFLVLINTILTFLVEFNLSNLNDRKKNILTGSLGFVSLGTILLSNKSWKIKCFSLVLNTVVLGIIIKIGRNLNRTTVAPVDMTLSNSASENNVKKTDNLCLTSEEKNLLIDLVLNQGQSTSEPSQQEALIKSLGEKLYFNGIEFKDSEKWPGYFNLQQVQNEKNDEICLQYKTNILRDLTWTAIYSLNPCCQSRIEHKKKYSENACLTRYYSVILSNVLAGTKDVLETYGAYHLLEIVIDDPESEYTAFVKDTIGRRLGLTDAINTEFFDALFKAREDERNLLNLELGDNEKVALPATSIQGNKAFENESNYREIIGVATCLYAFKKFGFPKLKLKEILLLLSFEEKSLDLVVIPMIQKWVVEKSCKTAYQLITELNHNKENHNKLAKVLYKFKNENSLYDSFYPSNTFGKRLQNTYKVDLEKWNNCFGGETDGIIIEMKAEKNPSSKDYELLAFNCVFYALETQPQFVFVLSQLYFIYDFLENKVIKEIDRNGIKIPYSSLLPMIVIYSIYNSTDKDLKEEEQQMLRDIEEIAGLWENYLPSD